MEVTPEIEIHRDHKTGHSRLDIILAISACLVSLVSVFLAIENAMAMRKLVAANSWPFVNVGVSSGNEGGTATLKLVIQNKGIGPAKIESLEVFYGGKPMRGGEALIHAMADDKSIPVLRSRVVGNVLSAKESVDFLSVVEQSVASADLLKLALRSDRIAIRTCYCSVFDECWLLDRTVSPSTLSEVDECAVPAVPFQ